MFKLFSILSFAIITSIHSASAQPTLVNKKINDSFTKTENKQSFILKSKYTSHEYLIQVAVPTTDTPKDGFPVLYLLDGNAAFDSATNIAKSVGAGANKLGLSPVAVVAIGYPNQSTFDVQKRALDYTPKASAKFQSQRKYKTTKPIWTLIWWVICTSCDIYSATKLSTIHHCKPFAMV